ncbi:AAA family ATPase [Ochrobactrum sp. RH2CCR150]|uniref:AAA family ATPase n=1 Tax=Ochrobactrum sp. RH2CCR150 TaxID=2587044 RepID=UPI0015FBCDB4|nr:adenylate kinase [Ochrobactrum sp. RH2CCR150]
MLNTKLIIVFGVSGIGKTTACANYASRNSNVAHFMASALLSLHRETAGTRTIDKAMQDQRLLVDLVCTLRLETQASILLLDAHNLIVVAGCEIVIPVNIIAAMKPTGLIFFRANGTIVSSRRVSRGDTKDVSSGEIERLQMNALKAVKSYANQIPCPLAIVDADQGIDLSDAIRRLS